MSVTPSSSSVAGRVAFVLKGYPRLSETFIAQEILALERRGLEILIVSLRHPTDRAKHPVHGSIGAELLYLPEYLYRDPLRVWQGWLRSRRRPGYRKARAAFLQAMDISCFSLLAVTQRARPQRLPAERLRCPR